MLNKKLTLGTMCPMKCSECLYFKMKKPGNNVSCSDAGVKAYAPARSCFFPDITKLNVETVATLATILSTYTAQQKKILFATIVQGIAKAKKKDFAFGTKVYISRGTGEYLSHYISAYVLGYTSDRKVILSGGVDKKTIGKTFIAYLQPESLMGYAEFAKIRKKLVAENKIIDPRDKKTKRISRAAEYDPPVPTIDDIPNEWTSKKSSKKRLDSYEKISRILEY